MKVLVVGSGAREHALVWKIAKSKLVGKIFSAPGNAGIGCDAECLPIKADDMPGLLDFARKEKIGLTVVGPEAALASGLADEFRNYGLAVFGPGKKAAQIESSKVFAKRFMEKYAVPTAGFQIFNDPERAKKYVKQKGSPCVVKADGLAAGKGVIVAQTEDEAVKAVEDMMCSRIFGEAGSRVIIEDVLEGQEASILVVTDLRQVVALASSQDHKRVFDADRGPNTGGMGAYSPAPAVTPAVFKEVMEKIIYRTLDGLAREGFDYRGVLYAGIMLTPSGPKVLEFNVRFGDPEIEAILPRLKSDFTQLLLAAAEQKLGPIAKSGGLIWDNKPCVCVVCASGGYPGEYEKGKRIFGLDQAAHIDDVVVFHAATERKSWQEEDFYVTNGGRVLAVTGRGGDLKQAVAVTYKAVEKINFSGMHYRRDIGRRALG